MIRSVDIFDTVLTRSLASPADLFLLLGQIHSGNPEQWMKRRRQTEQKLRAESSRDDITLEEIYQALRPVMNWSENQMQQAVQEELAAERRHLRPVPEMARRIAGWRRNGDSIVFLSDMYLPASFLQEELVRHRIWHDGDRLMVSGEEGLTKRTGRLFPRMLQHLNLSPKEVSHTGDDPESDIISARRAGLQIEPFTAARLTPREKDLAASDSRNRLSASRLAGAARLARLAMPEEADPQKQLLWEIGTSVTGPVLTAYAVWCLSEALRQGIQRLYFVSRDGQILYRIAQHLCRAWNLNLDCRYLYGSRHAWHLPALTRLDETALNWILDPSRVRSLDAILRRVGLHTGEDCPPSLDTALRKAGFNPAKRLHPLYPSAIQSLPELLCSDPICSLIMEEAQKRRPDTEAYLRQEGLVDPVSWALVDMGWRGRMQRSLRTLLRLMGVDRPVTGFYFALEGTPEHEPDDRLISWLDPQQFASDRMSMIPFLETLTAGDHGSVTGYRKKPDGSLGPAETMDLPETRSLPWVRWQQEAIVAFASALSAEVEFSDLPIDEYRCLTLRQLDSLFRHPSPKEARVFRVFCLAEDQGGGRYTRLSTRITPRQFWMSVLRGGDFLYRLRWPEGCIAGSLDSPKSRIALLHLRQFAGRCRKRLMHRWRNPT